MAIEELREEQCESRFRFLALDVFFLCCCRWIPFRLWAAAGQGLAGFSRMGSAVVFSRS